MAKVDNGPFTRAEYDRLVRDLAQLPNIEDKIRRAELCGVDCAPQKAALENLRDRMLAYKEHYFQQVPR